MTIMSLIAFAMIRFFQKIGVMHFATWLDVKFYYEQKEQRIQKGLPVNWFIRFLFKPWKPRWAKHNMYPWYRILQKIWEIGLVFSFIYLSIILGLPVWVIIVDLISLCIAFYFMYLERKYYDFSGTADDLVRMEAAVKAGQLDTWWLKRIYFAGYWLFRPFTKAKFDNSTKFAQMIMFLSSFIFPI